MKDKLSKCDDIMKSFTKDIAVEKYVTNGYSLSKLSKEYNTSIATIKKILLIYNIKINDSLNDNKKHDLLKDLTKEKFQQYFNEGKSYKEIADLYGASVRQVQKLNQNKYHIQRNKEFVVEQRKQTFINKYDGATCARQVKEIQDKIVENYKEKYGVENPSQNKDVVEKRKQTFINKYGVDNPFASSEVKETIKQTYKEKYGLDVTNPSQIPEINSKMRSAIRLAKIENSDRNLAQIEVLSSREAFMQYINNLSKNERNIKFISQNLNYNETTIGAYLKKYDLQSLITYHSSTSSYEKEIVQIFSKYGIIFRKNKTILDNQEIDLYNKENQFGIEFNGNYWHCELNKDRTYHQQKSLKALEKGVFLYHIFEYEWEDPVIRNKIISQLKLNCGLAIQKIFARECELHEITTKEKKEFYTENHIQGNAPTKYNYGLFYKGTLMAAMSFSNIRFEKTDEYELVRFCTRMNTIVVGGASKLFKHFIDLHPNKKVISYSDITKTKGTLYETLGFKCDHITKPDYVWWKSHKPIITRYQARVKNEIETMQNLGYCRIFDSGHKVWIYQ